MKKLTRFATPFVLLMAFGTVRADQLSENMPELDLVDEKIAKGSTFCNAGGYHCTGRFSEMLSHLYINNNQDLNYIRPHDSLLAEMDCSPLNGAFIPIYDDEKGSDNIINTLNIAYALDSKISLRIREGSDPCKLLYMRIYPG